MYNRTDLQWLESTFSAVWEGKVLYSRNVKPQLFNLGITSKESFLAYSTQIVSMTLRLVPGNVVMVAIDMYRKSLITDQGIYWITWQHVYFNLSVLFIVDTISILKLLFPIACWVCLDMWLLVTWVAVLLPLLLLLFFAVVVTVILIYVIMVISTTVTFVINVIIILFLLLLLLLM